MPAQKKAYSQKNTKWRKDCINGAENATISNGGPLRKSLINKRINYDLYSDILDPADVERTCNPNKISGLEAPARMMNYPICNPKIDLLVGESIARKFDWMVRVINHDAITDKEVKLKQKLKELMMRHVKEQADDEQVEKEFKKFQKFANFEYQDIRERRATHILKYLYGHLRADHLFSKGFKDALICAEEIYQCDVVAGEPIMTRLNTKNVETIRSGESQYIEDSDVIIVWGYHSPGKIIDDYHEYLTPKNIDSIENGLNDTSASKGLNIGDSEGLPLKVNEGILLSSLENNTQEGSTFDQDGNILVRKVYWKSMRKMKKVKYYDDEGDEQYELFPEQYQIDVDAGEEEEILWLNEWWEGHKIGGGHEGDSDDKAIYVRMQPRPIQFRSMENPSKCYPGIVGTIYNTNDNKGVSLMDRMKPFQYLYNVLAYNSEMAIAKNHGKIMRLDLSQVPEEWDIDQWLSFAQGTNLAVFDSFKEGNKGAAQGKLAGGMSAQAPVIDLEMGNTIQLYQNMMAFIKNEMGEISGVSATRLGQIQNKQAVGNVEQEITQTSMITEYWFAEHDYTKLRVLNTLLETAKHAWKDQKNKKVQYVLDDASTMMFEIDGTEFNECEYGIQITDGSKSHELLGTMKQLSHAAIQNGILNFSQLIDIYSTDSIASIKRKIEASENDKAEADAKQQEQAQKMQQEQIAAAAEAEEKAKDFKREEWDREDLRMVAENQNNLEIERMRQDNVDGKFYDKTNSDASITLQKLKNEADKIQKDYELKKRQQVEVERHNKVSEKNELKKASQNSGAK